MKILVIGAGVLGSLHAALLFEAGVDVSLLARGARQAEIREHGVLLAEGTSASIRSVRVPVVEKPTNEFDLFVILVRTHQLDAVLESLAGLKGDVLTALNWAGGAGPIEAAVGRQRVLLGFPAQGGTMDGEIVRYRPESALTRLVSMPIGELDGGPSARLERVLQVFRSAGFAAKAEPHMEAWLTTHAAFEVPLGQAVHAAGGLEELAKDPDAIRAMIRLMGRNLGQMPTRPVPRAFAALRILPELILMPLFRRFLRSNAAEPLRTDTPAVTAELERLAEQLAADAHPR